MAMEVLFASQHCLLFLSVLCCEFLTKCCSIVEQIVCGHEPIASSEHFLKIQAKLLVSITYILKLFIESILGCF